MQVSPVQMVGLSVPLNVPPPPRYYGPPPQRTPPNQSPTTGGGPNPPTSAAILSTSPSSNLLQKQNNFYGGGPPFKQSVPINNQGLEFDGKRLRKAVVRKTIDYNAAIVKQLEARVWQRDSRDQRAVQPDSAYYIEMVPPLHLVHNPINSVTTKFVRTSTNKMRCPIFCVVWTPEGRRLVTGASSGEFTLWNGLTFNFETILQAHDSPVRCMVWSHNDLWMVTGDHSGFIKYWQSNMNNVKMYQAHKEPLRGISFCPTDQKFATCSDDGTVRIWDFLRCHEEKILRGHGADVKCVAWHPQKSLVVSGSRDSQQPIKLWDPKAGQSLATLHVHKSTVLEVRWNCNGNWLLTGSRDHLVKLFDIRKLNQEVQTFRGHKKEVSSLSWHPVHETLFASGGSDGAVMFWNVGADKEVGVMEQAHDGIVWSLGWHPLGHILCSGSNDHTCKFWTRNRPGDKMRDKYNLNLLPAMPGNEEAPEYDEPASVLSIPGMGLEHGLPLHLSRSSADHHHDVENEGPAIPGLDFGSEEMMLRMHLDHRPSSGYHKKVPYAKPIPRQFQQQWMENKRPLLVAPPSSNNESSPKAPNPRATSGDETPPPPSVSAIPLPPTPPSKQGVSDLNSSSRDRERERDGDRENDRGDSSDRSSSRRFPPHHVAAAGGPRRRTRFEPLDGNGTAPSSSRRESPYDDQRWQSMGDSDLRRPQQRPDFFGGDDSQPSRGGGPEDGSSRGPWGDAERREDGDVDERPRYKQQRWDGGYDNDPRPQQQQPMPLRQQQQMDVSSRGGPHRQMPPGPRDFGGPNSLPVGFPNHMQKFGGAPPPGMGPPPPPPPHHPLPGRGGMGMPPPRGGGGFRGRGGGNYRGGPPPPPPMWNRGGGMMRNYQ